MESRFNKKKCIHKAQIIFCPSQGLPKSSCATFLLVKSKKWCKTVRSKFSEENQTYHFAKIKWISDNATLEPCKSLSKNYVKIYKSLIKTCCKHCCAFVRNSLFKTAGTTQRLFWETGDVSFWGHIRTTKMCPSRYLIYIDVGTSVFLHMYGLKFWSNISDDWIKHQDDRWRMFCCLWSNEGCKKDIIMIKYAGKNIVYILNSGLLSNNS